MALRAEFGLGQVPIGQEDEYEEEVEEDQDDDDAADEVHRTKHWPTGGLPEERELSPDDEGRPTVDSATRSVQVEVFSVISKDQDALNVESLNALTREETRPQDFDLGTQSQTVDEAAGPDAHLGSLVQPKSKLDHESEVCSDPTSNTLTKVNPANHVDSSTVALPPVFQALAPHIPSNFYTTRSHPWNRTGFRYLACGPMPPVTDMHNTEDGLSKAYENYPTYQTIETVPEGQVKWAWEDRSSYVYITKDGLSVTTDRGFRSARANLPIRQGRYFFEIILERAGGELNPGPRYEPEQAHVRIGLARRESGLNAPVGIDGYSYGIRDKTGEKVHLSKLQPYGERFGSGDVIGVYVDLPPMRLPNSDDPQDPALIKRRRIPIRFRRQLYFESPEYPMTKEMGDLAEAASPSKLKPKPESHSTLRPPTPVKKPLPGQKQVVVPTSLLPTSSARLMSRNLPILKGSKLVFFKNGVCQGVAFRDLLDFLPLRAHANLPTEKSKVSLANPQTTDNVIDSSHAQARDYLHDDGTIGYYPCVSVYGGGIARLNPGPEFKFPPPEDIEAHLGQDASFDSTGIPLQTSPNQSNQDSQRESNQSAFRTWQALSSLFPLYMAEQRKLDKLDAIEFQRRMKQEAKRVVQVEEQALKRRRVSSPSSSAPDSPTGTPSANNAHTTKASKPKKKSRGHTSNHHNAGSLNYARSQSFKPSLLAVTEVYGKSPPAIEPGSLDGPIFRGSNTEPPGDSDVPAESPPAIEPELSPPALNRASPPAIDVKSDNLVLSLAIPCDSPGPHTRSVSSSAIAGSSIESGSSRAAILPGDSCIELLPTQKLVEDVEEISPVALDDQADESAVESLDQPLPSEILAQDP